MKDITTTRYISAISREKREREREREREKERGKET